MARQVGTHGGVKIVEDSAAVGVAITNLAADGGDLVAHNAEVLRLLKVDLTGLVDAAAARENLDAQRRAWVDVRDHGGIVNGIADDSAAIQEAIDALPAGASGGGTVLIPGQVRIDSPILISGRFNVRLVGLGDASRLATGAAMTEMIRVVDSQNTKIESLALKANHVVSLAMVHVTAAVSAQRTILRDVFVDGNNLASVGFGVSLDYPYDTSEADFYSCRSYACTFAGSMIGDGQSGNVLNVRYYGCDFRHAPIGLCLYGGAATWIGGTMQSNRYADFYGHVSVGAPVLVAGVRSENSGRLWAAVSGFAGGSPVKLSACQLQNYTGANYTIDPATRTASALGTNNSLAIFHLSSAPFVFDSCTFRGPPSGYPVLFQFTGGNLVSSSVVSINNASHGSGNGPRADYLLGPLAQLSLIGGSRLDAAGNTFRSESPPLVGCLFTATADATVANSTAESTLVGSGVGPGITPLSLPANFFQAGRTLRVRASGTYGTGASGNLNVRVKLGSTVVAEGVTTPPNANQTAQGWTLDAIVTCRAVGASGAFAGDSTYCRHSSAGTSNVYARSRAATIDTTAAQLLALTAQWTVADANNTITCTMLVVDALN